METPQSSFLAPPLLTTRLCLCKRSFPGPWTYKVCNQKHVQQLDHALASNRVFCCCAVPTMNIHNRRQIGATASSRSTRIGDRSWSATRASSSSLPPSNASVLQAKLNAGDDDGRPSSTSALTQQSSPSRFITAASSVPRLLGPASLVGGTAAIYTSLLQHPSSTLTQLSFCFLMLLAVQYAWQPRLSRRYISPKLNKQSVALVEEVVKTGLAAAIFFAKPPEVVRGALKDWSLSSSLAVAGLPAMLYALQGVLQYVSYQSLDSVTFNGLTQTKTLSAAFCCWLIIGRQQSPVQMIALGILFGSALVFQGYLPQLFGSKGEKATATSSSPAATATQPLASQGATTTSSQHYKGNDWVWRGVVPCLGAAFLSGLAGALSQKGLQLTGISGRDPFLYTVEISFFSAITLLISMMRSNVFSTFEWEKQRKYWTWKTLIPIVVKATGGVVTALVHKHASSVSKGFALMFGLVLSNMIQLTEKQDSLQNYQVVGTIMIMLSTWLHFTHPPGGL